MSLDLLHQKDHALFHPTTPCRATSVDTALRTPVRSQQALPDLFIPSSVDISAELGGIGLGLVAPITGLHAVVNPYADMASGDEIGVFFSTDGLQNRGVRQFAHRFVYPL